MLSKAQRLAAGWPKAPFRSNVSLNIRSEFVAVLDNSERIATGWPRPPLIGNVPFNIKSTEKLFPDYIALQEGAHARGFDSFSKSGRDIEKVGVDADSIYWKFANRDTGNTNNIAQSIYGPTIRKMD